jgi:ribonuclease HI
MSQSNVLTINIDGAARGNPGPAAYAYVIARDGHPLIEQAECLGSATNNLAEYTALVRALERAAALGGECLAIRSDSELLVKQMNGEYRVKNDQLRVLYSQAKRLCDRFVAVAIRHVPRAENSHADRLCNEVLDGARGPAATAPAPRKPARSTDRVTVAREEALQCLQTAAHAWSQGNATVPTAEQVWDQLWSILEENGLVRPSTGR